MDIIKETVSKAVLPGRWEDAKRGVLFLNEVNDFTKELFEALDAEKVVSAAISDRPEDSIRIVDAIDDVMEHAPGASETPISKKELLVGYKLLRHEEVTTEDMKTIVADRAKEYFIDHVSDRLLKGGWD